MNYFTLSPPPSHWAELCKKASHSLILLPGFSSYRQIQCSWSPAVTVLTLSPSQLRRKGEKTGSFPEPFLFLSPRKGGLEGWRGGRPWYSRQPSLKCSCDPAGLARSPICPIAFKMCRMKKSFFFFFFFLREPKWAEYETGAVTQSTCSDYQPWCLIRD